MHVYISSATQSRHINVPGADLEPARMHYYRYLAIVYDTCATMYVRVSIQLVTKPGRTRTCIRMHTYICTYVCIHIYICGKGRAGTHTVERS